MPEYPRHIKRMIRQYAAQAYDAELTQALSELEQRFAAWHSGQISAGDLSGEIYDFTRGPARDLWQRFPAGLDDMQVARAITMGLLKRDELPDELLSYLQNTIAFFERAATESEPGAE